MKIQETTFGSIIIGDKTYQHDVVIEPGGAVRKRKKKLSKRVYGTSHKVSLQEMQDVCAQGARLLIVGTGQYDQLRLSKKAQAYLDEQDCEAVLLATPEALERWNEAEGQAIGLFHITC
jgi:hypothetical protein